MRKNYVRLALLATLTIAATGNVSAQLNNRTEVKEVTQGVLTQKFKAPAKGFNFGQNMANAPQVCFAKAPNQYGTEQLVMKEDFSKMTAGSEANPDTDNSLIKDDFEYPWINTKDEFFNTPGWGSGNAYSAGGMVYLESGPQDMAHINTPMLNVSDNGGIAWIRFKVRAKNTAENLQVMVEAAETFNMSPSWNMMGSAPLPDVTTEWKEYSMYFYGGGKYSLFNIVSVGAPIYVDDIEVFTVKQHVNTSLNIFLKRSR